MHYFNSRPADLSFPGAFCRQRDGGRWRELRPGLVREEPPFCLPTPGPRLRLGVSPGGTPAGTGLPEVGLGDRGCSKAVGLAQEGAPQGKLWVSSGDSFFC